MRWLGYDIPCEIPRWLWRTRAQLRKATSANRDLFNPPIAGKARTSG